MRIDERNENENENEKMKMKDKIFVCVEDC